MRLTLLTLLTVCWHQQPESSSRLPQESEQQLARLYGRAPYEGARRTLKKTPYLHFSSPSWPLGKRPRPRLVESIRGQSSSFRPATLDLEGSACNLSGLRPPTHQV